MVAERVQLSPTGVPSATEGPNILGPDVLEQLPGLAALAGGRSTSFAAGMTPVSWLLLSGLRNLLS